MFENTDENKLEYTPIFEAYSAEIEAYIEKAVSREIKGFTVENFGEMMAARKVGGILMLSCPRFIETLQDEICGDVFDLLLSLGDFAEFKELMLATKRSLVWPFSQLFY